jgi:hypothetical protein
MVHVEDTAKIEWVVREEFGGKKYISFRVEGDAGCLTLFLSPEMSFKLAVQLGFARQDCDNATDESVDLGGPRNPSADDSEADLTFKELEK